MTVPETLQDLTDILAERGERPALIQLGREGQAQWTYAALAERTSRLAGGLEAAGLGRGERVLLLAPNSPAWVSACLALFEAGAVPVPVDSQTAGEDLAFVVANSGARWAFTVERLVSRLEEATAGERPPRLVLLDGDEADERHLTRLMDDPPDRPGEVDAGDEAVLFYTSGTSGRPKGVPLSHRNLLSNLESVLAEGLVDQTDRLLLPLPLHHVYPFAIGMLAPLVLGMVLVLPHALTGPQLARAMREGEATVILGIPRLYAALYSAIERQMAARGRILGALLRALPRLLARLPWHPGGVVFAPVRRRVGPRLRLLVSGGAALDPDLARRLQALGWALATGYGLTESSPILAFNPPGTGREASAGRALRGVQLRIAEGREGERIGEVQARGSNVFAGYLDLPEETAQAFTGDGWFRTGDLGTLDREGWLYLEGRASARIVLPGGENVDPTRVEERLEVCPSVREAGVLVHEGGLAAVLVAEPDALRARSAEEIPAALRSEIATAFRDAPSHQRIGTVRIARSPLARTRLGRLRRHLLEERFRALADPNRPARPASGLAPADELGPEDRQLLEDPNASRLWSWLGERFKGVSITPDTDLQLDLGLDSLAWVELTLDLEQRLGLALEEAAVARVETVRDLLREAAEAGRSTQATADLQERLLRPEALLDPERRRWLEPPGPLTRALGAALHALARGSMRLLPLRVSGLEHLPREGGCILAPNHLSVADPVAILGALDHRQRLATCWGGWTGLLFHRPWTRLVSRALRVLPVDPRSGPITSLALGSAALGRGCILVWFPEGRRSPDGSLEPFRPGVGTLALARSAPLIPARLEGTDRVLPPGRLSPRRHPVRLTIGAPLDPRELEREGRGDSPAERVANALRARVQRLDAGDP